MIQNTVMSIYRKADEKKQNIFENLYLLFFVMITVMAFKGYDHVFLWMDRYTAASGIYFWGSGRICKDFLRPALEII